MSELIPANFGQVSTKFAQSSVQDDLSSGIQSSFGLIGYKGKVWSIRYRGDDTPLMRDDGDGPRGSIEVVILKASPNISKIWYEQGYVEGSSAAPDCFSNNGIAPEPTSAKRQSDSCALCPHNQWGSRITPAGKQGKACADSKRLAVVPLGDLNNEMFGGPMLLRVPAASLQDLAMYGQKMNQMGYPYYSIGTKISFDAAESYPKFVFSGLRPLNDAEADIVLSERDGHTVSRILSENEFAPAAVPAGSPAADDKPLFEQAPEVGAATNAQANTVQASVGDQARAAAAKVAADAKAANAKATKANAAEVKAAQEKAAQEKAARIEAARKALAEAEAEEAALQVTSEVPPVEPVESDEDRELREMEEKIAAAKARKAAAAQGQVGNVAATTTVAQGTQASAATQATPATVSPSEPDPQNMASSFEMNLDDMLSQLIPPAN